MKKKHLILYEVVKAIYPITTILYLIFMLIPFVSLDGKPISFANLFFESLRNLTVSSSKQTTMGRFLLENYFTSVYIHTIGGVTKVLSIYVFIICILAGLGLLAFSIVKIVFICKENLKFYDNDVIAELSTYTKKKLWQDILINLLLHYVIAFCLSFFLISVMVDCNYAFLFSYIMVILLAIIIIAGGVVPCVYTYKLKREILKDIYSKEMVNNNGN